MAFPTPTPQQNQVGAFVPTSFIWDVARINEVDVNSAEFKELLVRLYQNVVNIANTLNIKDSGYYNVLEFVTGQLLFPNQNFDSQTLQSASFRQILRKTIIFGTLPNTGTKSVAHGITVTAETTWFMIRATATDPIGLTGIEISYASPTLANNIEINVDATNINITTGSNRSNYTICNVVLEYVQI